MSVPLGNHTPPSPSGTPFSPLDGLARVAELEKARANSFEEWPSRPTRLPSPSSGAAPTSAALDASWSAAQQITTDISALTYPRAPPVPPPTIGLTGPGKLISLLEPQTVFYKDEGGKANQLVFSFALQGQLPEEIAQFANKDGFLPLVVYAAFEDGTPLPAEEGVLELCMDIGPSVHLPTRLGGIRYRLNKISKRLGDRSVCVVVSIKSFAEAGKLMSEPTYILSKRKDRALRLEEQAKEKEELQDRLQLVAKALGAGQTIPGPALMQPMMVAPPRPFAAPSNAPHPRKQRTSGPWGGRSRSTDEGSSPLLGGSSDMAAAAQRLFFEDRFEQMGAHIEALSKKVCMLEQELDSIKTQAGGRVARLTGNGSVVGAAAEFVNVTS